MGARLRAPALVVGACVAISVALLAVPAALAYDPWAWLVWGREVLHLDLDTVGGPSWKPLPVLATTPLALFGDAAPTLWLVVARTGGLLAVVGVFQLARRLAGPVAGVVASVALVLSPDAGPRFVRLVLEGHSAPLTAALAVWAIERHLAGKHAAALVLGTLLALDRPEAWPFLGLYVVWIWRREARLRVLAGSCIAIVGVLWLGGDWWGSGSPLHGADSARVLADDQDRVVDGLRRVGEVVVVPAWFAAAVAVIDAARRRDPVPIALGVGALAWFALVVGMGAALGYAALSRFLLPGAALLCVLAGVGVVRAYESVVARRNRVATVVAVAAAVLALGFVGLRARGIGGQVDEVTERAPVVDGLDDAIAAAGGDAAVDACPTVAVEHPSVPRIAAVWKLGVALGDVRGRLGRDDGVVLVRAGHRPVVPRGAAAPRLVRRGAEWDVWVRSCRPEPGRAAASTSTQVYLT